MADQTAGQALARADSAHALLLKQTDLQFRLADVAASKPSPLWRWLAHVLAPLLKPLAPVLKLLPHAAPYIFWSCVIGGALVILYQIGAGAFGLRRGAAPGRFALAGDETWRPAPEQARALLEDADRLAAEGRFEEAAHLILLRSIEDIQARQPGVVVPSLTSRDIGALAILSATARDTFSGIALAVEQSWFGGRPLGPGGFARCREAYAAFADAGSWA
jgi:hypothetical protein